jgi:hypothetical protein
MVVQAYVDDSGNEPKSRAFVLAGFVASPVQWAAFSDEWEKTLHRAPKLDYFKNNEAMGLKKQFDEGRGWTDEKRDSRLVALAQVVTKHIPEKFSVAIRHSDYYRYLGGIPVRKRMKTLEDPYFFLFYEFMLIVASVHSLAPKVVPCEFVFDDRGEMGRRAAGWWPEFKKALSSGKFDFAPYFTASAPVFKRDTEFPPLQAADLYAGQMNRVMRSEKIIIPPSPALRTLLPISGYHRFVDHKYLAPLRAHFMAIANRIEAAQPGTLRHFLKKKKTRKPLSS